MKMKLIPNTFGLLFITAFLILVSAVLYALPVWLLWNYLMPRIFGLPTLSILDAFLLNLLMGIFFRQKEKQ
ncbi:MAG: hypothetical protein KKF44_11785 [Nanoarchaeota archaeon]|nr:hypothetical protein [Nanoarchaeota archaeon]